MRKQWGLQNEEEEEYRRKLLLRARKGDLKAQAELMEKFGMRGLLRHRTIENAQLL